METVSDNPAWSKEDFAKARPFSEVFPELAKTISRRGPQKEPTKIPVNIRLSPEVVAYFKSQGPGWQTRINDVLVGIIAARSAKKPKASKKTPRRAA